MIAFFTRPWWVTLLWLFIVGSLITLACESPTGRPGDADAAGDEIVCSSQSSIDVEAHYWEPGVDGVYWPRHGDVRCYGPEYNSDERAWCYHGPVEVTRVVHQADGAISVTLRYQDEGTELRLRLYLDELGGIKPVPSWAKSLPVSMVEVTAAQAAYLASWPEYSGGELSHQCWREQVNLPRVTGYWGGDWFHFQAEGTVFYE